jgi:hypothetical protein
MEDAAAAGKEVAGIGQRVELADQMEEMMKIVCC